MKLKLGPGALVAAAFIGPGTVTACTVSGANFGFALLWTLAFATLATICLQDMAARLGAGARLGLGEALMQQSGGPWRKAAAGILVFAALVIGNIAYEGGNLAGATLGVSALIGSALPREAITIVLALLAGAVLISGHYKLIERILIALVLLMSLSFAASFILVRPDIGALLTGLVPRVPDGGLLAAIALIGTTIVPYNLFLHAAASRERWQDAGDLSDARQEAAVSIGLGGVISIMILATASTALFGSNETVRSAANMAAALEPVFGAGAKYMIGIGLFAAGLTSAITAPMATAYAISELMPPVDEAGKRNRFRIIAGGVLVIGVAISLLKIDAVSLILVAQAANGLLLPVVATFLLLVMNRKDLLGAHANGRAMNIAGWSVVALTFGLGLRGVLRAIGLWP